MLSYLPGFLAKRIPSKKLYSNIVLEGIYSIAPEKDELDLCPVRTLKMYIEATKCNNRIPQLFRKPGKNVPLKTRAISRNLINTIQFAYSDKNAIEHKIKGHDVRAVSASILASFKGIIRLETS